MLLNKRLYARVSVFSASLLIVMAVCSLICFVPSASAELTKDDIIAEMIAQMNMTEIYNTVYTLQNFVTRKYGTPENLAAAAYIYNRLSNISRLSVEYQGIHQNVIATLPGTSEASTETYMVGAHYDSVSLDSSYAPGATDNGGGVAIVLEFARIMSQYSFNHTLKFAFWNGEEADVGSKEYVQQAYDSGLNVSLYLNFDSSCYDPDGQMILDIMFNQQSSWVSEMITGHNTLYGINCNLTYNVHDCGSDHWSFWDYNYTAVMTHSVSHAPGAHSSEDTIDQVSPVFAQKNGQLGMSVVAALAGVVQKIVPEFLSAHVVMLTVLVGGSCVIISAQKRTKALKCTLKQQ